MAFGDNVTPRLRRRNGGRARDNLGFAPSRGAGTGTYSEADFAIPFNDAGSGAVVTTLRQGSGSATFTRATTAATRTGAFVAGIGYQWNLGVASGTARSYYNVAGQYCGYLSEAAATQLVLNPRDLSQAAWVKVNMTAALTSTGLENVGNTCTRLTCTVASDTVLQTITAAATNRTFSAFVKRITGTGTVTMRAGATTVDITALINSSTFTLVSVTDNSLNAIVGFTITTATDAIDVDCTQFEAGSYPTTPIPAAGTRNADVLTYTFSPAALNTVGTCSAKVYSIPTGATTSNKSIVSFATANQGPLMMLAADAPTVIEVFDGTNTLQKTGLSDCSVSPVTRVSAWSGLTQVVTGDGLAVSSGTFDGGMGNTSIAIGCDTSGATQLNGGVQSVSLWQQRFSNDQLQTLSQS